MSIRSQGCEGARAKENTGAQHLGAPLLVSSEEWRTKVIEQVNRPTFDRMNPPLVEVCRYISFEGLREALAQVQGLVRYLKADWLQTISESCTRDET